MRRVAIVGTGQTQFKRHREASVADLVREAVTRALEDAQINFKDIDAITVGSGPEYFEGINFPEGWLVDAFGGYLKPVIRISAGGATGTAVCTSAFTHVASGFYDIVLAVAYQKQSDGQTQYAISTMYDPFWGRDVAVGVMAFAASLYSLRIEKLGHNEERAAKVSVKNHKSGLNNPYAHLKLEISIEDVLSSQPLVWPIKRLDCPPISDGACAVVFAEERVAKKLTSTPVWIRGLGSSSEAWNGINRKTTPWLPGIMAANRAYKMAGITNPLKQIDVIEISDVFSFEEMNWYEVLGLCGSGEAGKLIDEGVTEMEGSLPVNPSGGVLCSNAIGAAGAVRVAEAALQLMGKAGARQIPDAKTALAGSPGGFSNRVHIMVLDKRAEQ
jgi:acetyl-CoA C-acetyltransferase